MTLLDSNVVIYAKDSTSPLFDWADSLIPRLVSRGGASINAIVLAELCVGASQPHLLSREMMTWGIQILDVPAKVAPACAAAYRTYRERRKQDSGKLSPDVPLPDFFIGAHAQVMGWEIATADRARFSTYFPEVKLIVPDGTGTP